MSTDLLRRREATVREHMDSENRHDFEATIATISIVSAFARRALGSRG